MRPDRHDARARFTLFARDVALRMPRIYTAYQLGHGERLRRRIQPSYEAEIRALARWRTVMSPPIREIIDVGANLGQSSWAFSVHLPAAHVNAYEANAVIAERCRALLRSKNVSVEALALGRRRGSVVLKMPVYRGVPFPGLASTDSDAARAWFGPALIRGFSEKHLSLLEIPCAQETLDALELQPDLVKIDVEGSERDVIEGARATIDRARPILLVECSGSFGDLIGLLEPYDYRAFELMGRRWAPSTGSRLNQLFVPAHRLPRAS